MAGNRSGFDLGCREAGLIKGDEMSRQYLDKKTILITALVAVAVLVSWFEFLDIMATDYLSGILVEAFTSFGAAKIINSTVSLLKHIEFSAVIMTINIGQVLDPMDRLVQQFAYLMKFSIASLIVQNILVHIVSSTFFKVFLTITGLYFIYSLVSKGAEGSIFPFKLFVFALLLRYLVVLSVGSSLIVDTMLLDSMVEKRMAPIEQVAQSVKDKDKPDNPNLSKMERKGLKTSIASLKAEKSDIEAELENLNSRIAAQKKKVAERQAVLNKQQERIGTVQSMWTNDQAYLAANKEYEAASAKLNSLLQKRASLKTQLTAIANDLTHKRARLHGNAGGLIDAIQGFANSVSSGVAHLRKRLDKLVNSLDDVTQDMIYVMVAFLFRSLIMPLIFLFLFIKGFKAFWHIDLAGKLA